MSDLPESTDPVRTAALLDGQEEERQRLARELHDGIGQLLMGIRWHIDQLADASFTERQRKSYEELQQLILETIATTRQVSFDLMPSVLSDFGLEAALRLLCERTTRPGSLTVEFQANERNQRLPETVEIHLYRITQEALTNALKYAQASRIEVRLTETDLYQLVLRIVDDGIGFSLEELTQRAQVRSGLRNMQLRAELLGGRFQMESVPGQGTSIEVSLSQ